MMTEEKLNRIYDILIKYGAMENYRSSFLINYLSDEVSKEWRFSGVFGFGGKFWANNYGELYANYYIEDQSLERELLLEKLNAELKEIQMEGGSSADKY